MPQILSAGYFESCYVRQIRQKRSHKFLQEYDALILTNTYIDV